MAKKKSIQFYRGNANLKAANIEMEYTEEQIEEIVRCTNDPVYFIKKFCYIIDLDKGLIKFDLRDYQEEIIEQVLEHNRFIFTSGRQSGKTAVMAALIAWYVIFHEYFPVAILANKEKTAKGILKRVKLIIEHLPFHMKPGVVEWNEMNVEFDNGSSVVAGATSATSISSASIKFLYIDEMGLIPRNIADAFLDSVLPLVASSKEAKIVMSSTPKGKNHFYKFFHEAEQKINGYVAFRVDWWRVPGRDEAWKEKMILEKGESYFAQEYACDFLGSGGTLLSASILNALAWSKPLREEFNEKFNIYNVPVPEHQYVCMVDVAEGLGADYSTVQVIDVTEETYRQVASFADNDVKPFEYHEVVERIAKYYNNGLVIIELNSCGAEVANNLQYDSEYDNLFSYKEGFGLKMTAASKRTGCANLELLLRRGQLEVVDYDTIDQLGKFVKDKKGSYSAITGENDDLVTPLVLFSFFILHKEFPEIWLNVTSSLREKINKEKQEQLDESFTGLFCTNEPESSDEIVFDEDVMMEFGTSYIF